MCIKSCRLNAVTLHTQTIHKQKNMTGIKLAYCEEIDWDRFLDSIDDRESMHGTWAEWHKAFLKTKFHLISEGFAVFDVVIDIDELTDYCRSRGIKNNGKARAQFVSNK